MSLPRTADGKAVYPGMKVFMAYPWSETPVADVVIHEIRGHLNEEGKFEKGVCWVTVKGEWFFASGVDVLTTSVFASQTKCIEWVIDALKIQEPVE
jgi:hypothetical protein